MKFPAHPLSIAFRRTPRARRLRRRGTTVVELAVAVGVLVAVTAVVAPTARRIGQVRDEADRRRLATAELSNVLAALSRQAPEELTRDATDGELSADRTALQPAFLTVCPDATLSVTAVPIEAGAGEDGDSASVLRLDGSLTWTTDAGTEAAPVRLSAWAFGSADPEDTAKDDAAADKPEEER
ncbi:MAG: hypothetical protein AAF907_07225 [Planctomycetota bacterium]